MGNACTSDENKTLANQDENTHQDESKNVFKQGNCNREEGDKFQSPDNHEQKQQELNDKYCNNIEPIDELPEITNTNVRNSINKHGSYVHQSNMELQQSFAEEPDLNVKITHRLANSAFQGEVHFQDTSALRKYQESGQVDFDCIVNAVGTKVFSNDSRYEGDFSYGKFNGRGRFIHANGDIYEGEFHENMACGKGRFETADGNVVFEGDFQDNLPEGTGVKVSFCKERYEGDFCAGKKHGNGEQKQEGVYHYIGSFKNDMYDGEGEYVYEDGTGRHYQGNWENGKYHGQGNYTFQNGDLYHGSYVNGKKQGQGKLTMNEKGIFYEGNWQEGKQHGQGCLYTAVDLKEVVRGIWQMGQYQQDIKE